jgi:hypothetical protein
VTRPSGRVSTTSVIRSMALPGHATTVPAGCPAPCRKFEDRRQNWAPGAADALGTSARRHRSMRAGGWADRLRGRVSLAFPRFFRLARNALRSA